MIIHFSIFIIFHNYQWSSLQGRQILSSSWSSFMITLMIIIVFMIIKIIELAAGDHFEIHDHIDIDDLIMMLIIIGRARKAGGSRRAVGYHS